MIRYNTYAKVEQRPRKDKQAVLYAYSLTQKNEIFP